MEQPRANPNVVNGRTQLFDPANSRVRSRHDAANRTIGPVVPTVAAPAPAAESAKGSEQGRTPGVPDAIAIEHAAYVEKQRRDREAGVELQSHIRPAPKFADCRAHVTAGGLLTRSPSSGDAHAKTVDGAAGDEDREPNGHVDVAAILELHERPDREESHPIDPSLKWGE